MTQIEARFSPVLIGGGSEVMIRTTTVKDGVRTARARGKVQIARIDQRKAFRAGATVLMTPADLKEKPADEASLAIVNVNLNPARGSQTRSLSWNLAEGTSPQAAGHLSNTFEAVPNSL
jgi:hypothetical protein